MIFKTKIRYGGLLFIAMFFCVTHVAAAADNPMTPLDHALVAANNDPQQRPKYYNLFLQSEIYIATHNVPEKEERKRLEVGTEIQPIILESAGVRYAMLFDTRERLSAWAKREIGFVRVPGHALTDMASPDIHWALNVGTEYPKIFLPEEIRGLKELLAQSQSKEIKLTEATEALVGAPAKIPAGLVESLVNVLSKNKEIREAYLGQVYFKATGEKPHLALVLRVDRPSSALMEAIKTDIGVAIHGLLGDGEYMDLIADENNALFPVIVKAVKPFYAR